jgi:hypothetical protein
MRAKFGPPKAITATAHKLARIFYRMWKDREAYTGPGVGYYETKLLRTDPAIPFQTRCLPRVSTRAIPTSQRRSFLGAK